MLTVTSVQAQNQFGKLLDLAQRGPVGITRHGRAAGYLIAPPDMERLLKLQKQTMPYAPKPKSVMDAALLTDEDAAKYVERMLAESGKQSIFTDLDPYLTPEAAQLSDADVARMVKETRNEIEAEKEARAAAGI